VSVGPFSPFPTRTKMRLKLLAAGTPTATSPDGADPARPGRPRRTPSLSQPKCLCPASSPRACPFGHIGTGRFLIDLNAYAPRRAILVTDRGGLESNLH